MPVAAYSIFSSMSSKLVHYIYLSQYSANVVNQFYGSGYTNYSCRHFSNNYFIIILWISCTRHIQIYIALYTYALYVFQLLQNFSSAKLNTAINSIRKIYRIVKFKLYVYKVIITYCLHILVSSIPTPGLTPKDLYDACNLFFLMPVVNLRAPDCGFSSFCLSIATPCSVSIPNRFK